MSSAGSPPWQTNSLIPRSCFLSGLDVTSLLPFGKIIPQRFQIGIIQRHRPVFLIK